MYLDHIHLQFPSPTPLDALPTFLLHWVQLVLMHEHGQPFSGYTLEEKWLFPLSSHQLPMAPQLEVESREPLPPSCWRASPGTNPLQATTAAVEFECNSQARSRRHFRTLLPTLLFLFFLTGLWALQGGRRVTFMSLLEEHSVVTYSPSTIYQLSNMSQAIKDTFLLPPTPYYFFQDKVLLCSPSKAGLTGTCGFFQ